MTDTQKAIRYSQTLRALDEMIDDMKSDLVVRAKQRVSAAESDALCFYGMSSMAESVLITARLAAFNDIRGMMRR